MGSIKKNAGGIKTPFDGVSKKVEISKDVYNKKALALERVFDVQIKKRK
jgi:hypothetical protein